MRVNIKYVLIFFWDIFSVVISKDRLEYFMWNLSNLIELGIE